jgi:hypothetical protein
MHLLVPCARLWREEESRKICGTGGPLPDKSLFAAAAMLVALHCVCVPVVQVMSARVHPARGSVNYAPEMVDRTPIQRTMGIFNAITTVLFAYGELQAAGVIYMAVELAWSLQCLCCAAGYAVCARR